MQGNCESSKGPTSALSTSIGHVSEGANAGDDPPALPAGVSRGPEDNESIELVYVLTPTRYGIPIIDGALFEELALGPFATLVEGTPGNERMTEGQAGSGAETTLAMSCPVRKSWSQEQHRVWQFPHCLRATRCLLLAMGHLH
ncbi:hypothetical protein Nepgr_006993 [Nepenthes gracilis]|uniref:Uncharacterized protein n=1 Tax=Nepenthes gracilis TaxID=150966 RepID=A0AAD3S645_NEPGR|nr:hypothetical protein Nepgr_006993 [Nepenthes gracilis]